MLHAENALSTSALSISELWAEIPTENATDEFRAYIDAMAAPFDERDEVAWSDPATAILSRPITNAQELAEYAVALRDVYFHPGTETTIYHVREDELAKLIAGALAVIRNSQS